MLPKFLLVSEYNIAQNEQRPIPTQKAILKMLKILRKPNIDTEKQKNNSDEKRYS